MRAAKPSTDSVARLSLLLAILGVVGAGGLRPAAKAAGMPPEYVSQIEPVLIGVLAFAGLLAVIGILSVAASKGQRRGMGRAIIALVLSGGLIGAVYVPNKLRAHKRDSACVPLKPQLGALFLQSKQTTMSVAAVQSRDQAHRALKTHLAFLRGWTDGLVELALDPAVAGQMNEIRSTAAETVAALERGVAAFEAGDTAGTTQSMTRFETLNSGLIKNLVDLAAFCGWKDEDFK